MNISSTRNQHTNRRALFLLAWICGFAGSSALTTSSLAEDRLLPWESLQETACRTGYTVDELREWFPPLVVDYDLGGLAKDRLRPPSAPGIHPRIFFNPDDLPELRRQIQETIVGKNTLAAMKEALATELTGDKARYRAIYESLAAGDRGQFSVGDSSRLTMRMAQEAFRCMIEEDDRGGRKVAGTIASAAEIMREELARVNPTDDWQYTISPIVGRDGLARCYDLAHRWMTDEQQSTVRGTLVEATTGKWVIGMDALPAWEANMMNWVPWIGGEFLVSVLAIEGEERADPTLYPKLVDMYRRNLSLGFFASGASYEGMAKNSPCLRHLIALAKRGEMLIGHTHARRHIDRFRLHTMQPWGGGWIEDGNWGGNLNRGHLDDFVAMKWAFPDDPKIDFLYRNASGPEDRLSGAYAELFPSDYDHTVSWETALKRATNNEPLTFFCPDRGLVISRSSWQPDALHFYFQPRSIAGGHRHGSRNTFVLSSHGRVWVDFTHMAGGSAVGDVLESRYQNVVLIDGVGQAYEAPPARMVDLVDSETATFGVGDARFAYSVRKCEAGDTPIEITPNDFRLEKSDLPWMNLPWKLLPDWYSSQKLPIYGQKRNHYFGCSHERKWEANWTWKDHPARRAFRTAGLVRGKHPYVVIFDDIQKDDAEHLYEFLMHVPDDVELESAVVYYQDHDRCTRKPVVRKANSYLNPGTLDATGDPIFYADVVLKEPDSPEASSKYGLPGGDRRLLVRILQCEGDLRDDGRPAKLETYVRLARWQGIGKRLVIPSRSVAPGYKLLIVPHRRGENLPITWWNEGRTRLTVQWKDQTDQWQLTAGDDGRTRFVLSRADKTLAEVH